MYGTSLGDFKTQQAELHRRAEHYRLVKSLTKSHSLDGKLRAALGRLLIQSGQELIARTQATH